MFLFNQAAGCYVEPEKVIWELLLSMMGPTEPSGCVPCMGPGMREYGPISTQAHARKASVLKKLGIVVPSKVPWAGLYFIEKVP